MESSLFLKNVHNEKEILLVCFSPGFILLTLYLSYQYNVRRRKHPEVVEPREERRIRQLPTRHGQGNKQQQASR